MGARARARVGKTCNTLQCAPTRESPTRKPRTSTHPRSRAQKPAASTTHDIPEYPRTPSSESNPRIIRVASCTNTRTRPPKLGTQSKPKSSLVLSPFEDTPSSPAPPRLNPLVELVDMDVLISKPKLGLFPFPFPPSSLLVSELSQSALNSRTGMGNI